MNESPNKLCPVSGSQRLVALDVLRGFSLLGILIMNVKSFAMIEAAYFFPDAYGDLSGLNLGVWWLGDVFANRKFMTLFSLLFGAGVILQAQRAQQIKRPFAGFFYRRMLWLWVIGMVHAYLLWDGDILVTYALSGLLLYPMRKFRPRTLLVIGLVVLAIGSGLSLVSGWTAPYWGEDQLAGFESDWKPGPEKVEEELEAFRGNWLTEIEHRAPKVLEMHLFVIPFMLFWRAFGVMLLGMALFKWGTLQGGKPRLYRTWVILGLVVGLPLTVWGAWRQMASGWDVISAFFLDSQFGYWGSLLMALGYAGGVFLLVEAGKLAPLTARLSQVGRMALSNYLLQTLLATFIFYGRGLGLFGSVPRIGQLGIVLLIWLFQLWFSGWWMDRYRFGPAEWLWRSLSYWKKQPLRRGAM